MNEQSTTKRAKFCLICEKKGIISKLKLHQLNFVEAIYMCPNTKCLFPLEGGLAESFVVKRPINIAHDSPTATPNVPQVAESSCFEEESVFAELAANLDITSEPQTNEAALSQPPCEDTDDIFDLMGWLEDLGTNDSPGSSKTPPEILANQEPKIQTSTNNLSNIITINSDMDQSMLVQKEQKTVKSTRRKVKLAKEATVSGKIEKVVTMAQKILHESKPKTRSRSSGQHVQTQNKEKLSLNLGLNCEVTKSNSDISKKTIAKKQTYTELVPDHHRPVKSMSLAAIIDSVTIKKRPQFFVAGAGTEKKKVIGKPAKRRKVGEMGTKTVLISTRPTSETVPAWLNTGFWKFGKTTYEGYRVSSKTRPEDETASEDSGIQSPNSCTSAGSGCVSVSSRR